MLSAESKAVGRAVAISVNACRAVRQASAMGDNGAPTMDGLEGYKISRCHRNR